jgi:hypothetical protein
MGDLGHIGITRTCSGAVVAAQAPDGRDLTREQKTENEVLSRNRILVENFFAGWKCLFGVAGSKYRGDLGRLDPIVLAAVAMTNWYIRGHLLRRRRNHPVTPRMGMVAARVAGLSHELDESGSDEVSLP